MRIGFGYDIHRLVKERKLILGGVKIPYELGLEGHSDADVLLHSVCDAILGAAGLGDIGEHFPDNDDKFKDISSLKLLAWSYEKVKKKNLALVNLDVCIVAEEPKLVLYKPAMKTNISQSLEVEEEIINIKATTNESLGFIGQKKGICTYSVALLKFLSKS